MALLTPCCSSGTGKQQRGTKQCPPMFLPHHRKEQGQAPQKESGGGYKSTAPIKGDKNSNQSLLEWFTWHINQKLNHRNHSTTDRD